MQDPCPLCGHPDTRPIAGRPDGREYRLCPVCALLHVPARFHISPDAEAARYRLHRNDKGDEGYVRFLGQLADPLCRFLDAGSRGIDYGSGPEGVLAGILRGRGFICDTYDPVFDPGVPAPPYDFAACAEVFEHFRNPGEEIMRLPALLRPGGVLGVMTGFRPPDSTPAQWHYTSDPTHVAFYTLETFAWIAAQIGFRLVHSDGRRVVILARSADAC